MCTRVHITRGMHAHAAHTVFHGEKLYEIFRINIVTTAYVHTKCTWFISFNVHSFNFRTWLGLQKCFNSEKFPNYGTCTSRVHNAQKGEPDNDIMHKSKAGIWNCTRTCTALVYNM